MARAALWQIILGFAATGLLLGCVEGGGPSASGDGAAVGLVSAPPRSGKAREVEAPEVFNVTDSALWDGRPSLGGIWVASPDAVDPERVVMFNPASGKTVTGALFRRERDNPGPALQISSDAAEALGMLAGQPTELRVTALRKIEPEAPAAAEPAAAVAAAAATDGAASETAADAAPEAAADADATETAALAAAALAATDAATDAGAAAGEAVVDGAADGAAAAVAEPPKRKTWKEKRAEAKARREAEKTAKAAAAAAAEGQAGEGLAAEGEAAATADGAAVAAVETAPLDARNPEVAAAAESAVVAPEAAPEPEKKTRRQIRAEEEAAAAAAAAAAADPAPAAAAGRPIQVASFSKEENANRAVAALAKIGVAAQPQKSEQGGKVVWGVVAIGDEVLLKSIKGAGFADAFFLQ